MACKRRRNILGNVSNYIFVEGLILKWVFPDLQAILAPNQNVLFLLCFLSSKFSCVFLLSGSLHDFEISFDLNQIQK
jgi:hypothetical protein